MYNPRIEGIRNTLNGLPFKEKSAVQSFMAEVRRVLDETGEQNKYQLLQFFASWAVHGKAMSKYPATMKELTGLFDVVDGMSMEDYLGTDYMQKVITLKPLRDALKKFLCDYNLPDTLAVQPDHWLNFVDLFVDVVQNVPLDLSKDTAHKPDDVKELVIRRLLYPDNLPTVTVWLVTLWDCRQYQASHVYNSSFRKL